MSQAPQNPFDTQMNDYQKPSGGSNTWIWVLGIVASLFLIACTVCCGFFWYTTSQFTGLMGGVLASEFQDDPVVVEHIGEITESEWDLNATVNASNNETVTTMVLVVKGTKGSGKIYQESNDRTGEATAKLVMDSGEEYPLTVPEQFGGLEMEIEGLEEFEMNELMEEAESDAATDVDSSENTPAENTESSEDAAGTTE